jgi:flagellin-like protein
MNGKTIRRKLVGSDDERAVSPVIGVILMVAITVILAAVIAAFVLDLGGSVSEEAQAGVNLEVDEENNEVYLEVTSLGNSDFVVLSGDASSANSYSPADPSSVSAGDTGTYTVGQTETLSYDDGDSGTVTAVAVIKEDGTTTQVGSVDYSF